MGLEKRLARALRPDIRIVTDPDLLTPAEFARRARTNPSHQGPRQCLLDAAELLERSALARNCFARDAAGNRTTGTDYDAVAYSVRGALVAVGDAANRALAILAQHLKLTEDQVWRWGDSVTREQAIAALRDASAGVAP